MVLCDLIITCQQKAKRSNKCDKYAINYPKTYMYCTCIMVLFLFCPTNLSAKQMDCFFLQDCLQEMVQQ